MCNKTSIDGKEEQKVAVETKPESVDEKKAEEKTVTKKKKKRKKRSWKYYCVKLLVK